MLNRLCGGFMVLLVACLGPLLYTGLHSNRAVRADWTTYLNGPDRVGATGESLPRQLELKWQYRSPASPEMAWEGPRSEPFEGRVMRHRVAFDRALQVAVANGRLFFGSSVDDKLHCVDAKTGAPIWDYFTEGAIRLSPTVSGGKVYFGSDDGLVVCLQAADGAVVWKHRVGPKDERLLARGRMISRWPIRTGVLVDGDTAFFGGGIFPHETVYLCAVNAETGEVIWKNDRISQEDAGRNPLSPQGYLLCSDDLLFVPSGRSLPAAFDRKTGKQVHHKNHSWRSTAGGVVGGSKALLADGQIYAAGDHHFVALDQKTGSVGHAFIGGHQLALSGDKAFVSDGKRIVGLERAKHTRATVQRQKLSLEQYALRRRRGSMKAKEYREQDAKLSEGIGQLSNVGSLWQTASPCDSALIAVGDMVVAGGQAEFTGMRASDGDVLWNFKVDGEAAGLASSDGRLYVSTDKGSIYCFAAPEAKGPDAKESVSKSKPPVYPAQYVADPFGQDALSSMYAEAAEEILKRTDIRRGFCLVLGSRDGRLAFELARRSKLRIYGVDSDATRLAEARRKLDKAGLYGSRVTLIHCDVAAPPLSNYFANLVVSDDFLHTGRVPGKAVEWSRFIKPCGGAVCLVLPEGAPAAKLKSDNSPLEVSRENLAAAKLNLRGEVELNGQSVVAVRDQLPGAGAWSHQYGDAGNTATSDDYRVKGGLAVLWYGDPGPSQMINRHDAAAAPLSTNGRMFIQGIDSIMAYDAYNGLFLWEYQDPGARRTGVFNNEEPSNLAASDDYLFVATDEACTVVDAKTGKVYATYKTPPSPDKLPRVWGFVAYWNGTLFGTSTIRKDLARSLRRRGHTVENATDAIFAVDVKTGKQKWLYRGKNVLHVTIAIGDNRVFFIDSSLTKEQRDGLLRQDKTELKKLGPEEAKMKEAELKKLDVRLAVCVDAETGRELWSRAVDVTDCSRVGIGGGNLTLMYQDGHVVICGANANGHYWRQFLSGEFDKRRLVVLDAENGDRLWAKDANYRHRPIVVANEIYAEPWAFDLHTGKAKERENPLTGEMTKWQFSRPGHHCGMITATPNMLFFRSGFTGYYDLYSDSGTSHFAGHRLGCWINAIPGNGLLMVPEASAGCVCQFSLASTIVMEPRRNHDTWKIYSATGSRTPVKELALNLGAPGDRRDGFGTLWLGFPRPKTVGRLEYLFDIKPKFKGGRDYYSFSSDSRPVASAETPWLYTSAARGLTECRIPLRGDGDEAAMYTVELHFAEMEPMDAGARVFDVRLQGQTVARGLDVVKEAGGKARALVKKFSHVAVSDDLLVELVRQGEPPAAASPILSAIRIRRED